MSSTTQPSALGDHSFDLARYKRTLGTFPTGVTVVTARSANGQQAGLTVNSFNSLSLSPPLIVWALGDHPTQKPLFATATHFVVNFLSTAQTALSQQFATPGIDRFRGMVCQTSPNGGPILQGCAAWLECSVYERLERGDHVLYLGQATHFFVTEQEPLVYFRSAYHTVGPKL